MSVQFRLEDLNIEALRKACTDLSISDLVDADKSKLAEAIKLKLSPDQPLFLSPATNNVERSQTQNWKSASTIIALFALLISILSAASSWAGTMSAISKLQNELDKETKDSWKKLHVYEIVATSTVSTEKWKGLSFEEIKSKYSQAVNEEMGINMGKKDIQPLELKRIIFQLSETGFIVRTTEDKYHTPKISAPSGDCFPRPTTEAIRTAIMKLMQTDAGKYDREKIYLKIKDSLGVSNEDFYATISCMANQGVTIIDEDRMIWTNLDRPTRRVIQK